MGRLPVLVLLGVLFLAPPALGSEGEAPPPRGHAEARAAHAWLLAVREYQSGLLRVARTLGEAGTTPRHQATYRQAVRDLLRQASTLREEAEEAFRTAFEASDWDAWVADEDGSLLEEGLDLTARHALEEAPARAVEVWDVLVRRLPESAAARRARTTWLPIALPSTGDLDLATRRLETMAEEAAERDRPALLVALGDVLAMKRDYEGARARYEAARAEIPEEPERGDPRAYLRRYLDIRLLLVGRKAPEIEGGLWLGGEPATLASLRGEVLLLDYWATW